MIGEYFISLRSTYNQPAYLVNLTYTYCASSHFTFFSPATRRVRRKIGLYLTPPHHILQTRKKGSEKKKNRMLMVSFFFLSILLDGDCFTAVSYESAST